MTKILLVDDEAQFAAKLIEKLEDSFAVTLITDPLDILENTGKIDFEHFDLILVDLRMPSMDGISFLLRLREREETLPPQILMTQFESEDSRLAAYKSHVFDFIGKSVSPPELIARLKNAIYQHGRLQPKRSFGSLIYDPHSLGFQIKDKALELTKKETSILFFLTQTEAASMDRNSLIEKVWPQKPVVPQTLNTHIFNLNLKLAPYNYQISISHSGHARLQNKEI